MRILCDSEIKQLIGNVIIDGHVDCVRPNSYIIRLGSQGEFLNSNTLFNIGDKKKGIKVFPGHSVALTAYETIDFRSEAVDILFPNNDLHGIISPTTDFSREGVVAPTTQIDAGYYGTLNWTITNTSNIERQYIYKEKIFRLTIFKLGKGERPESLYSGEYQNLKGYVPSRRKGAPVGMKKTDWAVSEYVEKTSNLKKNNSSVENSFDQDINKIHKRNSMFRRLLNFYSLFFMCTGIILGLNNSLLNTIIRNNSMISGIAILLIGIITFLFAQEK